MNCGKSLFFRERKLYAAIIIVGLSIAILIFSALIISQGVLFSFEKPQLKWRYRTEGAVISSPIIVNGILYIGSSDGHLYSLNASNGILIWSYRTNGSILSSPTYWSRAIYFGSHDYGL